MDGPWQRDAETTMANNGEVAANDDVDDDNDDDDDGNGDAASPRRVSVICGPICIFSAKMAQNAARAIKPPILLFAFADAAVPPC